MEEPYIDILKMCIVNHNVMSFSHLPNHVFFVTELSETVSSSNFRNLNITVTSYNSDEPLQTYIKSYSVSWILVYLICIS
jgi:REP element-mobilizing transposase RayT